MQVVLSKFVRQMGDLLPSTLYIPYVRMLKGLANGPQSAHYCFSLLKTNGASHGKIRSSPDSPGTQTMYLTFNEHQVCRICIGTK